MEEYLEKYNEELKEYLDFQAKTNKEIKELDQTISEIESEMEENSIPDDFQYVERKKTEEIQKIINLTNDISLELEEKKNHLNVVQEKINDLKVEKEQKSDDLINQRYNLEDEESVKREIFETDEDISENELALYNLQFEIEKLNITIKKNQETIDMLREELDKMSIKKSLFKANKSNWVSARSKKSKLVEEIDERKNSLVEKIDGDILILKQELINEARTIKVKSDLLEKEIIEKEKVIGIVESRLFDEQELKDLQQRTVIRLTNELEELRNRGAEIGDIFEERKNIILPKIKKLQDFRDNIISNNTKDLLNEKEQTLEKEENFSDFYDELCDLPEKPAKYLSESEIFSEEPNEKLKETPKIFETDVEEFKDRKNISDEDILGQSQEIETVKEEFNPFNESIEINAEDLVRGEIISFSEYDKSDTPKRWVKFKDGDIGLVPEDSKLFETKSDEVKRKITGFVKDLKKKFTGFIEKLDAPGRFLTDNLDEIEDIVINEKIEDQEER